MNQVLRNVVCLVVAVAVCFVLANWLHIGWAEALINNRTFIVYVDLISVGSLLSWLFYFVFFFTGGLLLAAVISASRAWIWGLSLGVCYAPLVYLFSWEWFPPMLASMHILRASVSTSCHQSAAS